MIQVEHVSRSFGPQVALRNVSLRVAAGESVVLVGPNGAGKTTLLRILATLQRPTSGTVRIAGLDPRRDGPALRRKIGFLSHRTLLYDDLSAQQNLSFYARLHDVPDGSARIETLLQQVGLLERRHDLVRVFSRGMQQRLAVARAVLHSPELLLLDEPYSGLDPVAVDTLNALLDRLKGEGCTLVVTTHALENLSTIGQRAVVLLKGRIVHDGAIEDPRAFPALYRSLVAGAAAPQPPSTGGAT